MGLIDFIDFIVLVDSFCCVALIWLDAMLPFWDVEIGWKSGKRLLVQYSSNLWIFKLMVEVRTFCPMALSCPGHLGVWIDMMFHGKKRPSSLSKTWKSCNCWVLLLFCMGPWKMRSANPMFGLRILLFRHGSSFKQRSLMDSAIAYVAQRICTEAVSAWFLPSGDPGTTSLCWQRMGMKLTSVTWPWRKQMHQVHLKKRYVWHLFL